MRVQRSHYSLFAGSAKISHVGRRLERLSFISFEPLYASSSGTMVLKTHSQSVPGLANGAA
jgi:hypothetical protein